VGPPAPGEGPTTAGASASGSEAGGGRRRPCAPRVELNLTQGKRRKGEAAGFGKGRGSVVKEESAEEEFVPSAEALEEEGEWSGQYCQY